MKTVENGWDFARLEFPRVKTRVNESGGEKLALRWQGFHKAERF
jgi:hypothetical protein